MTPEQVTLDTVLRMLIAAVVGGLTILAIPAIFRRFAGKLDNATEREKQEIERLKLERAEDDTEEQLDLETRQLTNRLARVAFDREEQLSRLKTEYSEQSELLRLTRQQLADCRDIQVGEYRHQVEALLGQINALENTIAKLRNDVAILEAMQ